MEHHELIAASLEELHMKTETHDRLWHLTESEWGVDQDEGVLEFATPTGLIVTCKVQIIGTYDTTNSTWLWSWDNRSIRAGINPKMLQSFASMAKRTTWRNLPHASWISPKRSAGSSPHWPASFAKPKEDTAGRRAPPWCS